MDLALIELRARELMRERDIEAARWRCCTAEGRIIGYVQALALAGHEDAMTLVLALEQARDALQGLEAVAPRQTAREAEEVW